MMSSYCQYLSICELILSRKVFAEKVFCLPPHRTRIHMSIKPTRR